MSQIIINGQPLYQVDLPEMTLAQWLALPVAERPKEWIRTDAEYTDIPAENVSYGSGSVKDALDGLKVKKLSVPVAGTVISGYYAQVNINLDYSLYQPIGLCEGANWDEKIMYSIGDYGRHYVLLLKSFNNSSYTLPSSRSDVIVLYVDK